jgi:predicted nucleic acid-binding protein
MKYVLDSNVAFKWLVPENDSDKANRLRDEFRDKRHELIAPDFFPIELAHALTRSERKNPPTIQLGEAELFWLDMMTTPPDFVPSLAVAQRAIYISSQTKAGVYDCVYAAIAEREGCEVITADAEMVKRLKLPFIKLLSTF